MKLVSVTAVEQHRPPLCVTSVRIVGATLPQSATDNKHHVEITTFSDVYLSGWSIRWFDALKPAAPVQYHTFAAGVRLSDSQVARVYGGLQTAQPEQGIAVYAGGADAAPSLSGAVFQLTNANSEVMHEQVVLSAFTEIDPSGLVVAVSDDQTRAVVIPAAAQQEILVPGHWRLKLTMSRNAGPDLPVLTVGGNSEDEQVVLAFRTD